MRFKFAEVRNIENDPSQSGRVSVRSYGDQDNEKLTPDSALPWAIPLQSSTSAATSGLGETPTGLAVGSRVMIGYMPEDKAEQFPIIMGSFSRAETPSSQGPQVGADPNSGGKIGAPAPDFPGGILPKSDGTVVEYNDPVDGSPKPNISKNPAANLIMNRDNLIKAFVDNSYCASPTAGDIGREENGTAGLREKYAPNADGPSTAAAKPGKDILKVSEEVGLVPILPNVYQDLQKADMMLAAYSEKSHLDMLSESYFNVLKLFTIQYSYQYTIDVLTKALSGPKSKLLSEKYKKIINDAHEQFSEEYLKTGGNLKTISYNVVVNSDFDTIPERNIVTKVPDLYIQDYYHYSRSKFPGYKTWIKPESNTIFYTKRNLGETYYETSEEEILQRSIDRLYNALNEYFLNKTLAVNILIDIFDAEISNIKIDYIEISLGKNFKNYSSSSPKTLLGSMAVNINNQISTHLPRSVIDTDKATTIIKDFSEKISIAKNMRKITKNAINKYSTKLNNSSNTSPLTSEGIRLFE